MYFTDCFVAMLSRYSRGADGTLYYQGNAVTAGKHQPSADWYAAK